MGELLSGRFRPAPSALTGAAVLSPAEAVPWDRRQRLWWLLWSRCPGVGSVRLRALARASGDLASAWHWSDAALLAVPGWQAGLLPELQRFRARWGADPIARLQRERGADRRVLLPGDRRWPLALREEKPGLRPPLALWWQGRGSLWSALSRRGAVAVVGTRRPSSHGLAMAHALGKALAMAGWPVVSGLAEGIDGAVHAGCLRAGGAPVAVLGTPLQRVYPRHHSALQREVGRCGLLVSEQPAGASVRAGHFAQRNRLLVALAAAVVVVECPPGSGALHSASHAWEQGLPLWVVPADAGRGSALGSNRLLGTGATPLLCPDDLITFLGAGPLAPPPASAATARHDPAAGREGLLAALGPGADLEELSRVLGEDPACLAAQLLDLELAGLVQAQPGLRWRPC